MKFSILCKMCKLIVFFMITLFARGLVFYSQLENICMTASFHYERGLNLKKKLD